MFKFYKAENKSILIQMTECPTLTEWIGNCIDMACMLTSTLATPDSLKTPVKSHSPLRDKDKELCGVISRTANKGTVVRVCTYQEWKAPMDFQMKLSTIPGSCSVFQSAINVFSSSSTRESELCYVVTGLNVHPAQHPGNAFPWRLHLFSLASLPQFTTCLQSPTSSANCSAAFLRGLHLYTEETSECPTYCFLAPGNPYSISLWIIIIP